MYSDAALHQTAMLLHTWQQLNTDAFVILGAVRGPNGEIIDFVYEYANPAAERILQVGPLLGQNILGTLPESRDNPLLFPRFIRLLEERRGDEVELKHDGDQVAGWFSTAAVPLDAERIAVSFRDITGRKEAACQLKLTLGQFKDRIDELLTMVIALGHKTSRLARGVATKVEALEQQVRALELTQDLLDRSGTGQVDLAELCGAAFAPFSVPAPCPEGSRPVVIEARHVIPMVMILHELAGDALKGDPAPPRHEPPSLGWTVEDGTVFLRWNEIIGGPPQDAPSWKADQRIQTLARSLPCGSAEAQCTEKGRTVVLRFHDQADRPA